MGAMYFPLLAFLFVPMITVSLALPLTDTTIQRRDVPDFVTQYAPIAYLCSTEIYLPSDIGTQLYHTHPENGTGADITPPAEPLTLSNLDSLNAFASDGTGVYLTSNEGIEALPLWFRGVPPDATTGSTGPAVSCAIVTVAKANDTLDAFYFYFYAYNQGNWVLNLPALEFGDHVGDWEHTMVRFVSGVPQAVWFSQHSGGEAFTYDAVQKDGLRPIVYVANGTHANYAIPGPHDHTIPDFDTTVGPLTDHTDQGPLWDPLLSAYLYSYDVSTSVFTAYNNVDPVSWLAFDGRWGDNQLPDSTPGQVDVFGEAKYVAGPTGPNDKDLARTNVCPDGDTCNVLPVLVP